MVAAPRRQEMNSPHRALVIDLRNDRAEGKLTNEYPAAGGTLALPAEYCQSQSVARSAGRNSAETQCSSRHASCDGREGTAATTMRASETRARKATRKLLLVCGIVFLMNSKVLPEVSS